MAWETWKEYLTPAGRKERRQAQVRRDEKNETAEEMRDFLEEYEHRVQELLARAGTQTEREDLLGKQLAITAPMTTIPLLPTAHPTKEIAPTGAHTPSVTTMGESYAYTVQCMWQVLTTLDIERKKIMDAWEVQETREVQSNKDLFVLRDMAAQMREQLETIEMQMRTHEKQLCITKEAIELWEQLPAASELKEFALRSNVITFHAALEAVLSPKDASSITKNTYETLCEELEEATQLLQEYDHTLAMVVLKKEATVFLQQTKHRLEDAARIVAQAKVYNPSLDDAYVAAELQEPYKNLEHLFGRIMELLGEQLSNFETPVVQAMIQRLETDVAVFEERCAQLLEVQKVVEVTLEDLERVRTLAKRVGIDIGGHTVEYLTTLLREHSQREETKERAMVATLCVLGWKGDEKLLSLLLETNEEVHCLLPKDSSPQHMLLEILKKNMEEHEIIQIPSGCGKEVLDFFAQRENLKSDLTSLTGEEKASIINWRGTIIDRGSGNLSYSQLKSVGHLDAPIATSLSLPELRVAGDIDASFICSLDISSLESAGKLLFDGLPKFEAPKLQTVKEINGRNIQFLDIPSLEFVEDIVCNGLPKLEAPNLQTVRNIFVEEAHTVILPSLTESTGSLDMLGVDRVELPLLKKARNLSCRTGNSLMLPALQEVRDIYASKAVVLYAPNLVEIAGLWANELGRIELPSLKRVDHKIEANKASYGEFPALQDCKEIFMECALEVRMDELKAVEFCVLPKIRSAYFPKLTQGHHLFFDEAKTLHTPALELVGKISAPCAETVKLNSLRKLYKKLVLLGCKGVLSLPALEEGGWVGDRAVIEVTIEHLEKIELPQLEHCLFGFDTQHSLRTLGNTEADMHIQIDIYQKTGRLPLIGKGRGTVIQLKNTTKRVR